MQEILVNIFGIVGFIRDSVKIIPLKECWIEPMCSLLQKQNNLTNMTVLKHKTQQTAVTGNKAKQDTIAWGLYTKDLWHKTPESNEPMRTWHWQ